MLVGRLGRLRRGFGLLSGTAGLSEDQVALQKSALDFAKVELAPYAGEWDKKKYFPKETLRKAAGLGFAGVYSEETYGGSGLGRIEGSLIFEALATGCPSTSAYLSIHNMCNWMISAFAQETQKQAWLPKVNSMEYFTSYCLTEPAHGSNAYGLETKAVPTGNYYEVTGSKAFISGGSESDLYVVMCRVPDKGVTCLVIPKDSPGLRTFRAVALEGISEAVGKEQWPEGGWKQGEKEDWKAAEDWQVQTAESSWEWWVVGVAGVLGSGTVLICLRAKPHRL